MTTTFGACSSGPSYGSCREDVDRGAGDLSRLERGDERSHVDELAPRRVHDPDAVAHVRDRVGVDRVARVGRQRQMKRHEVGALEHLCERSRLDTELAEPLGRHERVVRDDLHLQRERAARDLPADPPEAEHPEHLVGELHARPSERAPSARP